MTWTPGVGDDLEGVRGLSASLDEIAGVAGPALLGLTDEVEGLVANGQVDLAGVERVGERLGTADRSFDAALAEVDLDSSGYVSLLGDRFDDYVDLVDDVSSGISAGRTAAEIAPTMLGADGPRNYLLVFQNNAEIRATGGLSGAWARLRTDDGRLDLVEQGSAGDFPMTEQPVVDLTEEEQAVYGDVVGQYFQDPLMVPDFPRSSEIFDAFWTRDHPDVDLDGVISLDTVALSYLLRATDPVDVEGYTLTPDNVVQAMLSDVYAVFEDPQKQDDVFAAAAAAIFTSATTGVVSPAELVKAVDQAVDERRLLVRSFEEPIIDQIAGTRIAGELSGDDGDVPHVDVTVNDATGAKMSYYLDYDTEVTASSCADGVQTLDGRMAIRQTIPAEQAASLPFYVTGGGVFGVEPGRQQTIVRLYAPHGGSLGDVAIDGEVQPRFTVATIDGREVMTLFIGVDGSADVELTWQMTTGPGQNAAGELEVTPKVTPGRVGGEFASAC